LVEACDRDQRCARPEGRGVHAARSEEDRGFAETLGRTEQARKANPYRSALSALTFYINRAGKNLPASRRKVLDRAKDELKEQFHRD
jgi:hypothetical protein